MNEENKNKDLNYDFNFENQVVNTDNSNVKNEEMEILEDPETELLEEENVNNDIKVEELKDVSVESDGEKIDEGNTETEQKKIKILNKEFNFEDIVLVIIGLVIVAGIFLLPRIMNIFN